MLILLIISVIIQLKQPRKKFLIRRWMVCRPAPACLRVCVLTPLSFCSREDFEPSLLHPGLEPPHYELCALRRAASADLADAAPAEDFDQFHKLRRSSSRCIRDHHCGSQQGSAHGSVHGSRSNLSTREAGVDADGGGPLGRQSPGPPRHTAPPARRSVVVMKHSCSQDGAEEEEEEEELTMDEGVLRHQQHHLYHGSSGHQHTVHRTLSNDF